jgi:hypothetical protein
MMHKVTTSETSVRIYHTTRRYIPKDSNLQPKTRIILSNVTTKKYPQIRFIYLKVITTKNYKKLKLDDHLLSASVDSLCNFSQHPSAPSVVPSKQTKDCYILIQLQHLIPLIQIFLPSLFLKWNWTTTLVFTQFRINETSPSKMSRVCRATCGPSTKLTPPRDT